MTDLTFGGYKWIIVPGFELNKQEVEMLGLSLPMMEKRIHQASELLAKFNREEMEDFRAEILLSTTRMVPEGKDADGNRSYYSAGMTGDYPDLKGWRVQVCEGVGSRPFYLVLLKQSEEMGDATYFQPVAFTPVDHEDLPAARSR